MVNATYQKLLSKMGDIVHETAWDEIKKAGDEERKIALEEGNIDEDGNSSVYCHSRWPVV